MGASTLSTAQKIALFSVLDVPYSTKKTELTTGNLAGVELTVSEGAAAKTLIEARLSELADEAEVETELKTLLTAWIAVKDKVRRIDGGSVGNVSGVSEDPADKRARYERQIRTLVPFYPGSPYMVSAAEAGFIPRIY